MTNKTQKQERKHKSLTSLAMEDPEIKKFIKKRTEYNIIIDAYDEARNLIEKRRIEVCNEKANIIPPAPKIGQILYIKCDEGRVLGPHKIKSFEQIDSNDFWIDYEGVSGIRLGYWAGQLEEQEQIKKEYEDYQTKYGGKK